MNVFFDGREWNDVITFPANDKQLPGEDEELFLKTNEAISIVSTKKKPKD